MLQLFKSQGIKQKSFLLKKSLIDGRERIYIYIYIGHIVKAMLIIMYFKKRKRLSSSIYRTQHTNT